ncbi:glycerate kinase [Alkaliphilus serpentinus]|uniref:Glycerate kinase n=1 Tax=Alkaliphilus serpentinus TaxID=1482731 RepID=A0A833HQ73_9FIRM|nr:glycerate kinase [Alkaliphilus serpentinus]KAB3531569.1 glycerate kinase [Alkaliphilus serpentinus]
MKIVVAPDSFKGSLSAVEVAARIEEGIKRAGNDILVKKIPVADGGEGTVEALVIATEGRMISNKVSGPLMEEIDSYFGILGDDKTAVIEMAAAAGLSLVKENLRNPMETTTYGVGELIRAALDWGCKRMIIGIGGSSTNDGGMGMAQALGAEFYDDSGSLLKYGGKQLSKIHTINVSKLDERLKEVEIIVACDVNNPLYGPEGAAHIYGPQKGATPHMVEALDKGLRTYADKIKELLKVEIAEIPGSGAAGGLGGGLIAFTNANLSPGIDIVTKFCRFEEEIIDADLLITGEGKTDKQTAYGKVPVGLATIASKHNVPVVCLSGGLAAGYEEVYKHGIDATFSNVCDCMTLKEAMDNAGKMLVERSYSIARLVKKLKG